MLKIISYRSITYCTKVINTSATETIPYRSTEYIQNGQIAKS